MLTRHRDICLPRGRKPDTSNNFPLEESRRRVFATTDPTDDGVVGGELEMEKYNIAGLDWHDGMIATAFAGALRAERVKAMAIHSTSNVRAAAGAASVAPFRKGPRLVAIGSKAAEAVTKAGQKLGTEGKSDLFGAVGRGEGDARIKDTLSKAESLLIQICEVEKKDPVRAKERFQKGLVGLAPGFENKV